MIKSIFFCLFIYSGLAFSSNNDLNLPEYPESHLIGKKIRCFDLVAAANQAVIDYGEPSPRIVWNVYVEGLMDDVYDKFQKRFMRYEVDDDCFIKGWHKQTITAIDVAGQQYDYYYSQIFIRDPEHLEVIDPFTHRYMTGVQLEYVDYEKCPDGANPNFLVARMNVYPGIGFHAICVQDHPTETDFFCGLIPAAAKREIYKLLFCKYIPLSSSETTSKTLNKLRTEANSKLGSIANSNATNLDLWAEILDTFKKLFSPASTTPTTPTTPTTTDLIPVPLSNTSVDLNLPPSISASSDCPASLPFSVFNYSFSISNEPFCNLAVRVRPLVIASAQAGAAAFIIYGAL